jgi:hypothetical protein
LSPPVRQLLVYRFPREASFEGQLVGALQRIESGGAIRVVDAVFVGREPESGELVAASLNAVASSGMVASLLGFRLDQRQREETTGRVLAGPDGEDIRAVAAQLGEGDSLFAVLLEHIWATTLAEGVARVGGEPLGGLELIDAASISELLPRIRTLLTSQQADR